MAFNEIQTASQTEDIILLLRINLSIEKKPTDFKKKLYNKVLFGIKRKNVKNKSPLTDNEIIQKVIDYLEKRFNLPENWNHTKNRKRELVEFRQVGMNLIKSNTKLTLSAIGMEFGNRDHATVLHARKTVSNLYETDLKFKDKLDLIANELNLDFIPYMANETD